MFCITYIITSIAFLRQLGYLLSNFYQSYVLMRTLGTHGVMIFEGMDGKLASKNLL